MSKRRSLPRPKRSSGGSKIFHPSSDGETFAVRLKRLSKILIHYGGPERPDKLLNNADCLQVGRPSKFCTANRMPNAIRGKRKAAAKVDA
jgi:hypothetical protein